MPTKIRFDFDSKICPTHKTRGVEEARSANNILPNKKKGIAAAPSKTRRLNEYPPKSAFSASEGMDARE